MRISGSSAYSGTLYASNAALNIEHPNYRYCYVTAETSHVMASITLFLEIRTFTGLLCTAGVSRA